MKTSTQTILTTMHVIMWVLFIGTCIKTGALLFSFFVSMYINPIGAKDLHQGLDLSELMNFNKTYYSIIMAVIIILSALKAYICYLVIQIFLKLNLAQPFSGKVSSLVSKISYVACGIGIVAICIKAYGDWLTKKGIGLNNVHEYLGGGAEFLFFGGIVFVIALVFRRGIEIQKENELTI